MTRDEYVNFLKKTTISELLTQMKLAGGSTATVVGNTTPEGWPFMVIACIGRPENSQAWEMAKAFHEELSRQAPLVGKSGVDDFPPEC